MMTAREREMARLYMEAIGLIVKLTNKIKHEECPNAQEHLQAAQDFLERNELYQDGINGLLK